MTNIKKRIDLSEGPFLKKIAFFVIPLIITGLLQCFYNAADLAVVGKYRGEIALAAVGSTASITNLIIGLFLGLSVGAGVAVARFTGARDEDRVDASVHTSIALAAIAGLIVGALGYIFAPQLLIWMDTPENVLPYAVRYSKIIFIGAPALTLFNYCSAMVRALGDTVRPLIFLTISGVVNVLLNRLFVVTFGMHVEGVAIATISSQYLAATLIIVYMRCGRGVLKFNFRKIRINSSIARTVLLVGIPMGIQSALFSFSNVLIQSSVNTLGDAVMAGVAAASSIEGFVVVAFDSVCQAATTFVGQCVGAEKYKNIKKVLGACSVCIIGIGVITTAVILPFHEFFINIYVNDGCVESVQAALERILIVVPFGFAIGFMNTFAGALRSMGKSISAMVIVLFFVCVFRVAWLETVFPLYNSVTSIFISYPLSWALAAISNLIFLIITYKRMIKRQSALPKIVSV